MEEDTVWVAIVSPLLHRIGIHRTQAVHCIVLSSRHVPLGTDGVREDGSGLSPHINTTHDIIHPPQALPQLASTLRLLFAHPAGRHSMKMSVFRVLGGCVVVGVVVALRVRSVVRVEGVVPEEQVTPVVLRAIQ